VLWRLTSATSDNGYSNCIAHNPSGTSFLACFQNVTLIIPFLVRLLGDARSMMHTDLCKEKTKLAKPSWQEGKRERKGRPQSYQSGQLQRTYLFRDSQTQGWINWSDISNRLHKTDQKKNTNYGCFYVFVACAF
jgi:hypothetical protein